jgi:hypothetical protein
LGDHFSFVVRRAKHVDEPHEGAAVRYHVTAELAGPPSKTSRLTWASATRSSLSPMWSAGRICSASLTSLQSKYRRSRWSSMPQKRCMPTRGHTQATILAPASKTWLTLL